MKLNRKPHMFALKRATIAKVKALQLARTSKTVQDVPTVVTVSAVPVPPEPVTKSKW